MSQDSAVAGYLDPRDRAHVESLEGGERDVVISTVARYRREDRLAPGDRIPDLALLQLETGAHLLLSSLVGERPLVLVFGSFT